MKELMYSFVDYTWNPVKGKCDYDCSYCYMKKWGNKQKPLYLDEKVLKKGHEPYNTIFVCSGCDLFHPGIPGEWIDKINEAIFAADKTNGFILHTKNPKRIYEENREWPTRTVICVTVESNIPWPEISKAPQPFERIEYLRKISQPMIPMITIEPVMDFDVMTFSEMILSCKPYQVNIGADSGRNNLPEPTREKVEKLINLLSPETQIHLKENLRRILPESRYYGSR